MGKRVLNTWDLYRVIYVSLACLLRRNGSEVCFQIDPTEFLNTHCTQFEHTVPYIVHPRGPGAAVSSEQPTKTTLWIVFLLDLLQFDVVVTKNLAEGEVSGPFNLVKEENNAILPPRRR